MWKYAAHSFCFHCCTKVVSADEYLNDLYCNVCWHVQLNVLDTAFVFSTACVSQKLTSWSPRPSFSERQGFPVVILAHSGVVVLF